MTIEPAVWACSRDATPAPCQEQSSVPSEYYKPGRTAGRGQSAEVIVVPLTNCTHGSDAPETGAFEIGYFFAG